MIDAAIEQIKIDNEKASKINLEDETDEFEDELFHEDDLEDVLTDNDFIDWFDSQKLEDEEDEDYGA